MTLTSLIEQIVGDKYIKVECEITLAELIDNVVGMAYDRID